MHQIEMSVLHVLALKWVVTAQLAFLPWNIVQDVVVVNNDLVNGLTPAWTVSRDDWIGWLNERQRGLWQSDAKSWRKKRNANADDAKGKRSVSKRRRKKSVGAVKSIARVDVIDADMGGGII